MSIYRAKIVNILIMCKYSSFFIKILQKIQIKELPILTIYLFFCNFAAHSSKRQVFKETIFKKTIMKTRALLTVIAILTFACAKATTFEMDGIWYSITSDHTVCLVIEPSASGGGASFVIRKTYEGDIIIPETVTYGGTTYNVTAVEDGTFKESPKLTSVSIPATVTDLGETPFSACGKLNTITVAPENPAYTIVDGLLYDKAVTTLLACPGTKTGGIVIPSTVATIGKAAFQGCASITSVDIPQTVNEIGARTFYGCKKLTGIVLPEGVPCVGDSMCSAITSVTLPQTITSIGVNAFYHCNLLKTVTLPDAVEEIHERAFNLCYGMTTVTTPANLKRIDYRAFDNCTKLKAMTLPASLTLVDSLAFCGCSDMRRIDVAEGNTVYCSADGVLFNKDMTTLVCCPAGKLGDYVVPESVTTIGDYGFYYCRTLQSITLPYSLKAIGNHAFRFCSSLKTIALPPTLEVIQHDGFSQCPNLKSFLCYAPNVPAVESSTFNANNYNVPLYVPYVALDNYQNADYWKNFTIQPISSEVVGGILGDANGDGKVSISDVTVTVNAVICQDHWQFSWQMADINFDGSITIADITGIVSVILGE